MWKWITRQRLIARHVATSDTPAAEHMRIAPRRAARVSGKYAPLHEYWRIGSRTASFSPSGNSKISLAARCQIPHVSSMSGGQAPTSTQASHRIRMPGSWPAGRPRQTSWPGQ